MAGNIKRTTGYFLLSGALVAADQMVKRWAYHVLRPVGEIPLIRGLIGLRYAENTGAAFSAFSGATELLGVFSLIVCAALAVWMIRRPGMPSAMMISLAAIMAGGVGNLIDRAALGYVIDLFEFQFVRFAVFNVADICITLGSIGLFISILLGGDDHGRMAD